MPLASDRIEFPLEGFSVTWDEGVLIVQVIDYHATVLRLPWQTVLELARRAGAPGSRASDATDTAHRT